VNKQVQEKKQT